MYIYQKHKGALMAVIFLMTIMVAMMMSSLFLSHQREYRIQNTISACRDMSELLQSVNRHYAKFIKEAGEYIDTNTTQDVTIENLLLGLWATSGSVYTVPSANETGTAFITRLGLSSELKNPPFDSVFVPSVTINSKIDSYITNPVALSHIPYTWNISISIQTRGNGDFDIHTLREYMINDRNGILQAISGLKYTSLHISKLTAKELTIIMTFKIPQNEVSVFYNYGM